MQVADNKVVFIQYTLRNESGEMLDSSENDPLAYIQGFGNIIPGLENALLGKVAGDKLEVNVAPEDGYGERNTALVQVVPRSAFEGIDNIEPGMRFQAQADEDVHTVMITQVEEDQVHIDANHPLAGVTLSFEVEITEVREATAEELEHGHVHGPGGHQH